ncbi:MAG: hypothetical protein AB7O39_10940 [Flavobacteriaceae bacterium]
MAFAMRNHRAAYSGERILVVGLAAHRAALRLRAGVRPGYRVELESVFSEEFETAVSNGPFDEIHYFALRRDHFEAALEWLVAACRPEGALAVYWPVDDAPVHTDLTEPYVAKIIKESRSTVVSRERSAGWHRLQVAPAA